MIAFRRFLNKKALRAVSGEFLATLLFVMLGLGSTINWEASKEEPQVYPHPASQLVISLCFGLSFATMVQGFSKISGAHTNPAITLSMVFTRQVGLVKAFCYVVAQCLGAITGSGILYVLTPKTLRGQFGVTRHSSKVTMLQGFILELLITFQLVFTVLATCDPKSSKIKDTASLAVGFSLSVGHLFALPYTGASMNPARSLGPAVVTGNWQNHWVYWVGPILGGIIAAALHKFLRQATPKDATVDTGEKYKEEAEPFQAIEMEKAENNEAGPFDDIAAETDENMQPQALNGITMESPENNGLNAFDNNDPFGGMLPARPPRASEMTTKDSDLYI
ncbi:aquaporin-4-like [Megalops cyprinoides]|uniref:aquaporin-4-like n=1 Tax=Megalops cyprinoides TaxID=118141 RepID=UPI001864866C|nr:aquaporin-4-like [Megalops cyprinoides]